MFNFGLTHVSNGHNDYTIVVTVSTAWMAGTIRMYRYVKPFTYGNNRHSHGTSWYNPQWNA